MTAEAVPTVFDRRRPAIVFRRERRLVISIPVVAVIGRPNVGKSTLFNRLVGRRQAIVHDQPGITRDRIFGRYEIQEERFVELVDTGGLVPGDDPLGLSDQVMMAIEESDLLLLVVDGKDGLTTADERVWQEARKADRPAILVVNKGDTKAAEEHFHDFYSLGLDRQVLVSAEHGRGIEDLSAEMLDMLGEPAFAPEPDDDIPCLAIVGRPNVGKSSLVNRMVGKARVLVSPVAGTTRDPIDTLMEYEGKTWRLIDTAGIRRRSQTSGVAEDIAIMFARRQMERAHAVVLVVDASAGITSGDMAVAGAAWEMGRAVVVAINKWDLLDDEAREKLDEDWPRLETLLSAPERVNISAVSGRRLDRLLPAVDRALERSRIELGTSELNRLIEGAIQRHEPPQKGGRQWKVYYSTQVGKAPPTFMLFANRTLDRSDSYRRYLENRIREALDLGGVPIRLVIRRRDS